MKRFNTLKPFYLFILLCSFQLTNAQNQEEERQEMLQLVNDLRSSQGLSPVELSTVLNNTAQEHSEDMTLNNFFSHTGSNGSNFSDRIRANNYDGAPRAENIAAGSASAANTFSQWKNSDDHLRNMLLTNINQMGIGHAIDQNTQHTHYWTQVFGSGNNTLFITDFVATQKNSIQIFPNPVVDELTIVLQGSNTTSENFYLTDSTGKVFKIIPINTNQLNIKINMDDIPSGLYFLKTSRYANLKIIKT